MVRKAKIHALKRPKLRQTWNKHNLYNIWRQRDPKIGLKDNETFFQQKWRAKGLLRAYHGSHIRERDWERMFSRRLLSVANMDPHYMAEHDGSEMAAGRGSGHDERPAWDREKIKAKTLTPYMNMAFAPMERRLDIAVFRAMFASSALQARQFIVHNGVKVNGKTMPHPTYNLNPGDMFSVNPDMVMAATGKIKEKPQVATNPNGAKRRIQVADGLCFSCNQTGHIAKECPNKGSSKTVAPAAEETVETDSEAQEAVAADSEAPAADLPVQDPETTDKPDAPSVDMKPTRDAIQSLLSQAKEILAASSPTLKVKQKRDLRAFIKQARPLLSKSGRPSATPSEITSELTKMVSDLNLSDVASDTQKQADAAQDEPAAVDNRPSPKSMDDLDPHELKALERLLREEEENPYDPSKPYKTPWEPKPFMSPFAFIPKYLEVNQNVCSAVYLRHPVARVGSAEVPTPFPYHVNQLAFNWYLRRR